MDASQIIELWPGSTLQQKYIALASDLGVGMKAVEAMYLRNRINSSHWAKLLEVAKARGIELTAEDLIEIDSND